MNLSSSVLDLITAAFCITQQELVSGKATPVGEIEPIFGKVHQLPSETKKSTASVVVQLVLVLISPCGSARQLR